MAVSTAAALTGFAAQNRVFAGETSMLKIGLIGCGGRGCGAVGDALTIDPNVKLIAAADIFDEKAKLATDVLRETFGERIAVTPDTLFSGFDGYQKVLATDCDVVILATPQFFRPMMLKAAIAAGKHVFAEKPVAVDGAGIRMVLEAAEEAKKKGLNLVSGLVNRYYPCTQEIVQKIQRGAIGNIISATANRMGGQLWAHARREDDTEMMYQMRNWVNFCWMASEYINDVTIHQIDVALWCMGDPTPTCALGFGGRMNRRGPDTGDMYDAMSVSYEFEDGRTLQANSRQVPGAWGEAATWLYGTNGYAKIGNSGYGLEIYGPNACAVERSVIPGTQMEHKALLDAVRSGGSIYVNNGAYMANSTGTALLGRLATYTGQKVTWEEMLAEELPKPAEWNWDALPPTLPNEQGQYKVYIPNLGWDFM